MNYGRITFKIYIAEKVQIIVYLLFKNGAVIILFLLIYRKYIFGISSREELVFYKGILLFYRERLLKLNFIIV